MRLWFRRKQPEIKTSPRILIVGGGITGIALAALLERRGLVPDVVEKMSDWSKSGYGITIMPAGLIVLRHLQLMKAMREDGTSASDFHFLTPDGTMIRKIGLSTEGIDSVTLHRADLHDALRSRLSKTHIRMGLSIAKLDQDASGVRVTFSDGTKGVYDFVVGADGVRSVTRALLFPTIKPKYSGAAVWTFFLPQGIRLPSKKTVLQTWSDDEFMGIFPIKDSAAVTFAAPLGSRTPVDAVDLGKRFKDIHFLARDILSQMSDKELYTGHLKEVKLGTWYVGRVVLAGDAAHAMMPATGMGASMGLQDAFSLAELLATTHSKEWNAVPERYQEQRKRKVDDVQREAYAVGRMMFLDSPAKEIRNTALKLVPQFVVSHRLKRVD